MAGTAVERDTTKTKLLRFSACLDSERVRQNQWHRVFVKLRCTMIMRISMSNQTCTKTNMLQYEDFVIQEICYHHLFCLSFWCIEIRGD